MAKNIPITARVSKGLFGQKATEPVLNVGQAGAYGNNVTKSDPSPAKMMKSPLKQMKSEGAGDKILKGQANVSTMSTTPGEYVPGKKGGTANTDALNKQKVYRKELEGYGLRNPKAREAANKAAADAKAKDAASGTEGYNKPAETVKSTEPLKVFNEGSAKTSFWRRQDDRAVTHTSRKTKRAQIQKAGAQADVEGLKGKEKRDYVNKAKKDAKLEMYTAREAGYKGSRDAAVLQGQQSATIHDKIVGVQVDPSKSQELPIERTVVGDIPKYKMQAQMEAQTFTGDLNTTTPNSNPLTGKPAGGLANTTTKDVKMAEKDNGVSKVTEKNLEDDKPMVESATKKSANGFFVKKSPLKMKYFK